MSSPTKRDALRRQVAILERLLEAGRWPSGLELTSRERDVITHNLERDRRALEEGSEP
jgi:uncharacterized protein YeaC (DUF1315 family)